MSFPTSLSLKSLTQTIYKLLHFKLQIRKF